MSKPEFKGLIDTSGYEIEFVEFNSPVWTGTGYAAGITVSRSSTNPTDRPRCSFAEIVSENWRFVMGSHGAVLVSNANIKFIWTVGTEVFAGKSEHDEESMALPESLRDVAHALTKKSSGAHTSNSTPAPASEPVPAPTPEPDPAAHFKVENPPTPETTIAEGKDPPAPANPESGAEKVKKRRGRPPGAKNKAKAEA